jgi:hypothetical protein
MGKELSGDTARQYRIFGARIFFHANDLAGIIADLIPYVRMNTIVREKEFDIQVDGARIVTLYNIDPSFAKIISPCRQEVAQANILPAEVALVDVYHKLYSPSAYKSWTALREHEAELWKSFIETRDRVAECDSSATKPMTMKPINEDSDDESIVVSKKHDRRDRHRRDRSKSRAVGGCNSDASGGLEEAHVDIVVRWLKTMREYAIVGNFALTCMNGKQCPTTGAMQIIVNNVEHAIDSLTRELSKYIPKAKIESRMYDLQLPTDYRIKKYVIIARVGADVYYIANLFNCADYELIPYATFGGLKIATQDVILRFLFIELWYARVVHGFGKMTQREYTSMVKTIFANSDTVRASWIAAGPVIAPPTYIGTHIDESVSKKTTEMVPPYYPAQYKRLHGSYRDLNAAHRN